MDKFEIPLWLFPAMQQADFTDGDIGQLARMLYEYFVQDKMPEERDIALSKMKTAFYFALAAMEGSNENIRNF